MRDRPERSIETRVSIANRRGAVHVARRTCVEGDSLERNALTVHDPVDAGKPGRQYAFAHTASTTDGRPHLRHVAGGSAERNSSSGSTRIVAFVSSLICASHSGLSHHPA